MDVAVELRHASDAGASEQLELVTGEALEHQPKAVLEVVVAEFGVERTCGAPDVDDKRYDSYNLSMKAVERRKRKLRAISDPQLALVRDKCIRRLDESKSGIAQFYGVGR